MVVSKGAQYSEWITQCWALLASHVELQGELPSSGLGDTSEVDEKCSMGGMVFVFGTYTGGESARGLDCHSASAQLRM